MKKANLLYFNILLLFASCRTPLMDHEPASSFLPMTIGNQWTIDSQNYTEIQDTLRMDGKLYYKFYSLIGGDAVSTAYLRIDENNRLIESWPDAKGKEYTRAKFNSKVGDSFFTLNDRTANDYKVTVIEKTDTRITFSFEMIYHDNMEGEIQHVTYIKGQGLDERWKSIKIDGKIIKQL